MATARRSAPPAPPAPALPDVTFEGAARTVAAHRVAVRIAGSRA
jgi:hypothetical protein